MSTRARQTYAHPIAVSLNHVWMSVCALDLLRHLISNKTVRASLAAENFMHKIDCCGLSKSGRMNNPGLYVFSYYLTNPPTIHMQ